MNFSQGHSGTEVQCELCLFSYGKTPEFTKMGEIHELFVLALSLVWFAGATPDLGDPSRTLQKNSLLEHFCASFLPFSKGPFLPESLPFLGHQSSWVAYSKETLRSGAGVWRLAGEEFGAPRTPPY